MPKNQPALLSKYLKYIEFQMLFNWKKWNFSGEIKKDCRDFHDLPCPKNKLNQNIFFILAIIFQSEIGANKRLRG